MAAMYANDCVLIWNAVKYGFMPPSLLTLAWGYQSLLNHSQELSLWVSMHLHVNLRRVGRFKAHQASRRD